jgi:hypothetical protein
MICPQIIPREPPTRAKTRIGGSDRFGLALHEVATA